MRTVPADVTEAITLPTGHNQGGRITIYKSRNYFDELTSNNAPSVAKDVGYTGKRLNEASFLLAPEYRPEIVHQVITAFVSVDGNLFIMLEGSSAALLLLSNIDPSSHIGFNANNAAGIYSIYYYNTGASQWEYQHIDIDLLMADGSNCLTGVVTAFPELPKGSIYPLVGTENTFVLLDIYEGAVRVRIYDDNKDTIPNDYRFMNPLRVLDPDTEDAYLLHKAGAVLSGNKVFVYFSHYDGSVKSMICTLNSDLRHGVWSDIRTSIPQDLSNFYINNVFQHNGRIFIAGNFSRKEQFASPIVYTLLVWSDDGLIFTMNRRVLCSLINLPFHVHTDGVDVVFTSTNRIYRTTAPYQIIGENAEQTVVEIVSISGSVNGEMSAVLAAGSEQYFNDSKIDTGSYAKLDMSIISLEGKQYVKYFDVVVSGIGKQVKDGGRGNSITLQTDANWHTANMTHPFYMEFQGKQSVFDRAIDFSNLYKASTGVNPDWTLGVDFWAEDGTAIEHKVHTDESTIHWSADLSNLYDGFPVFGNLESYTIKVFGWSRAGKPDTNPNTADDTDTTTLNDKFLPVIEYLDLTENKIVYESTEAYLTSAFANPPQTYFEVHDGSYPVVMSIPNPGEGRKITRVGVKVVSQSPGKTTYYLERIEMPEILVNCIVMSGTAAAFDTVGITSSILTDITPESYQDTGGTEWSIHGYGEWRYKHSFSGLLSDQYMAVGEQLDLAQTFVECIIKNDSTLAIREIRKHIKAKVISTAYGLGYIGSRSDGLVKYSLAAGDVFEYTSEPFTLAPGAEKSLDAHFLVNKHWISTGVGHGYYADNPTTIDANVWFTVGSTVLEITDNFFDSNPNAFKYRKYIADPAFGQHYFVYQKIKNDGTTPWIVKSSIRAHNNLGWGKPMHYKWVSPTRSEDETSVTQGTDFEWISDDITVSPGEEKLVYIEFWCDSWSGDSAGFEATAYFIDASATGGLPTDGTLAITRVLTNKKKGIPQIVFSTKPYSAWNFEAVGRFEFKGDYANVGLVGLATDEKNFVVGCITNGKAYLAHMKNGKRIVLQEFTGDIFPDTLYDLRLWHREGVLGLEYKLSTDLWPQRGSQVLYEWRYVDGAITSNDDIYHVGAYSYLDPPRFQIVGMSSGQSILAALPIDVDPTDGDSDLVNRFPDTGRIDVDGIIYNYTGRNVLMGELACGPFQLRNVGSWKSPFNKELGSGFSYQGGLAIECLDFKWLDGADYHTDYAGCIMASSAGYAWLNEQTMYKPWIKTNIKAVRQRNRARFYSKTIPILVSIHQRKGIYHQWVDRTYSGGPIGCHLHAQPRFVRLL